MFLVWRLFDEESGAVGDDDFIVWIPHLRVFGLEVPIKVEASAESPSAQLIPIHFRVNGTGDTGTHWSGWLCQSAGRLMEG